MKRYNRAGEKLLNIDTVFVQLKDFAQRYDDMYDPWDYSNHYYDGHNKYDEYYGYDERDEFSYDWMGFERAKSHDWNCSCNICKGRAGYKVSKEEKRKMALASLLDNNLEGHLDLKQLRKLIINRKKYQK